MAEFALTEKQLEAHELLQGKATHILLYGGARSAKTFLLVRSIVLRALKAPFSRHAVLRYRFNHVKASVVFDTFPKVINLAFHGTNYFLDKTDWFVQFDNGSQIWFGGLDEKERTEKILGQEHCIDPDSVVLTGDLQWVKAKTLVPGKEIIAFPEKLFGNQTLISSYVTRSDTIRATKYRVVTDRGETIVSAEHQFVNHPSKTLASNRPLIWKMAKDLVVGDRLKFTTQPWQENTSFDSGWMSGILDGEGCVSMTKSYARCQVNQNKGVVLDEIFRVLNALGIKYTEDHSMPCVAVMCRGLWPSLRLLGITRPCRLLPKAKKIWEGKRPFNANGDNHFATVLSVESIGDGDVIALGTTSKTFIADGFLGHNSTIFLNECSQIPKSSRDLAVTRLAQKVHQNILGNTGVLPPRMYYDENPPSKNHWTYKLFIEKVDPNTRKPLPNPENYASLLMNPIDNIENIGENYLAELNALPAHQRLRFLRGEFSDGTPNALFHDEHFETWRVTDGKLPDMVKVVVAVDPSGAGDKDNAHNDAIGIVVAGLGVDGNGYILEDCTIKAGPATWGRVAVDCFHRHEADVIVGESNYGGEMVKFTIQTADRSVGSRYRPVTATRGKHVRASPIASLYEKGKIRHVGQLRELEDELLAFTDNGYTGEGSPNRADAAIFAVTEIFKGIVSPQRERPKFIVPEWKPFDREMGW